MTYRPHWRDTSTISEREIEHRLTSLEHSNEACEEDHQAHRRTAAEHRYRLNLHERAIIILMGALYILLQDKFPTIAAAVRGALK